MFQFRGLHARVAARAAKRHRCAGAGPAAEITTTGSEERVCVQLYVLGGFDWNNELMHASEVYDSEADEWKAIENTGHPQLQAPQWYKKNWRPEWRDIVLHNSSYFCSYTEANGRVFVKEYDPETGNWKLRRPKLKSLSRYGLSTVLAGKLHTADWGGRRLGVADTSGRGWIPMKENSRTAVG